MKFNLTQFNPFLLPAAGVVALSVSCQSAADDSVAKRPNVIFILTDDQGYGDLSCHGNEIINTPNLDALHADAVRFTDFHVSPTSAPSRSALMTGRYSNRVGVWHTIGGRSILWEDETTLPQVFSESGYTCGIFGKWHLGDNYPSRPEDRGFDEVVIHGGGGISQGPDYWGNYYFDDHYRHNGVWEEYSGYCTDVFFGEAMRFIEENKDEPFFCYIPVNAPHAPLNVPQEYYDKFRDADLLHFQKQFYGMITNIDDNYGLLVSKLDELGLTDDTIIIFMTDNGSAYGYREENGRSYGNNGGLRGGKGSAYEGGHRVPFFMKYPAGGINGGYDIENMTSHIDFMPTLIDICGLDDNICAKELDGRSMLPLIEDQDAEWSDRAIVVDSQRRQNLVKWMNSSVMREDWRLINGKELYDINADQMQTNDIAAQNPEIVKMLRADYEKWWQMLLDEDTNLRYAYITAGTEHENPVKISVHDMHAESGAAHHHIGVRNAANPMGNFKLEIATTGSYKFELCRYPKESNLTFSSFVPEVPESETIGRALPKSRLVDYQFAEINIAQYTLHENVDMNASSVVFNLDLEAGKYDLDTFLQDKNGVKYPPYYIYVEKL